jgi:hypothetical protein
MLNMTLHFNSFTIINNYDYDNPNSSKCVFTLLENIHTSY